ncbi:magnesium-translocating P-type ATPase [Dyadobacter jiangsuensis]|uniref:Magnesium-transporting ATPase, P-type 1 n=1 Tax=Dyadobacter jiangsuensis TaxID=1591085 RepID=A0A2P8GCA6_9BACT|nr:magnesium-translocating P-type ATPase [Dyadobacter jiangsuensis]PSL31600.1 Mg2+-importing ATPase [Dyadobacter jiangsuensis]
MVSADPISKIQLGESPLQALYQALATDGNGLDSEQAGLRQQHIRASKPHTESGARKVMATLVNQFRSPLVLLLVVAVILSAFLGEVSDTLIIGCIILASGLLSFWQEYKAGKAVEKLQKLISQKSTVIRGNTEQVVDAQDVVPGDLILLKAGDIIPADCRIIESNELHVNESSLTGESFPAEKMQGQIKEHAALSNTFNCLWQGTNVISGTSRALVVRTCADTVFGKLRESLSESSETAFEHGIRGFGYFLLQITTVLTLVILSVNIYFGKPWIDSVLFSLALAVGMAPELLPAIMTVAMSTAAARMMERKVIVKKLSSIFNLGEVTVLCTDKTGTITEGSVRVCDAVDGTGISRQHLRQYAYLNAVMQQGFVNPIDEALSDLTLDSKGYRRLNEVPYDFIRKRLTVLAAGPGGNLMISKGALESILEVCSRLEVDKGVYVPLDEARRRSLLCQYQTYCEQGYRVLGIAVKQTRLDHITRADESEMAFAGYLLLEDPLKSSSLSSIQKLRELGVEVKIITGDNRFAAMHIAKTLGISGDRIMTGPELDMLTPEAFGKRCSGIAVYAEIEPHQKVRVVKALREQGAVTAYIGDGINDVAAINAADAGISTHNAVDVAKQAADFVLMEKDLSVLADGILEGRKSFANSMKYIFITTGATFGNMFSVAGASLLLPFLPMLPKQILLTNFITDLPALAIASDQVDPQQTRRSGKWSMSLIRRFMVVFGLHSSFFDFLTFYVLYFKLHLSGAAFRTGWFIESVITELLILLVVRTRQPFLSSRPAKALLWLTLAALLATILLPVSPLASELGFTEISQRESVWIAGILVLYVVTADMLKVRFFQGGTRAGQR